MNTKQLKAAMSQGIMYEIYLRRINSQWASQRQTAIVAKTFGVVYWDRVMFQEERIAKCKS